MSSNVRTMKVCDYVERPFLDVTEMLSSSDAEELLTAALRAGLGPGVSSVEVRAVPQPATRDAARFDVDWCATDQAGGASRGTGSILVLVVDSGRDAVTELLVTVLIAEELAVQAAAATHRFLHELTRQLRESAT